MKVENIFPETQTYLTAADISVGDCFRYVGETEVYFMDDENYAHSLATGKDNYSYDEETPVEAVIGRFVVEQIISDREEYEDYKDTDVVEEEI